MPLVKTEETATDEATPAYETLLSWVSTVDHKRIGILYICTATFFLAVGGLEALLMRFQLLLPRNDFLSPDFFNQMFTMHGTTMVFLVGMPVLVGFANYFVPLMIGARDVAFPRLNAMSYWMLPMGGILLYFSFFTGKGPDAGWFSYAPLSTKPYNLMVAQDYWITGLLCLGVGSVASSINIFVTVLSMRAPGMSLQRVPLFVWMSFMMSILTILALPALNAALAMLLIDRWLGAAFFEPARGGSAILWQHFFWVFGHPEVYILILPAFGMISEVIPVFSRKPIYGYTFVAVSSAVIVLLSYGVWAHHMFAVGLGMGADIFFAVGSLLIALPTGVKIFNWTATMWGGSIRLTTAMLFAVAFLLEFVIGGLSGVMFAAVPIDWQLTDSYFVVAHFHYVLIGGTVFGVFAATFYWFPKMTGRMLNETLGKWQFWLWVWGMNATFMSQHLLGVMGMPRRVYTYADNPGWMLLNVIATLGAIAMAAGTLVLLWNVWTSLRSGEPAGDNPWNAYTLEWATSSPPPVENFEKIPEVKSRRPVWDMDQPDLADWKVEKTPQDSGRRPDKMTTSAWAFIASEAVFFLLLLVSYVVFNARAGEGPTSENSLDVTRTGAFTVCLLASSITFWFAELALAAGKQIHFRRWLTLTILLGSVFIAGQVWEYIGLLQSDITIDVNLFAATFFTVTGFHGMHVIAGLITLSIVLALAMKNAFSRDRTNVLRAVGVYWHFVDVVWIIVFSIVYLGYLQ
ncbi:cytochrome c oxidase subunit I [Blastopirellula marina]|uniref:Cytochrome c oxidase subunit 1 n=1 Tax=Blastopirellula marina TaxID=124 RepID=A0A2S8G9V4_9BACT|nr:cytochrome c oxidase subunit I [Blastopirellula marina]PQO41090.1 cytochrome c oxidase subunit I [Blastopirellula marina]PTL45966.1 cytochrome c oxidase subunit I [Blastopirellula marina]